MLKIMAINDELGDKKNEFLLDVGNFITFIEHKYGNANNKKDYAFTLSAIVDTHHEMPEKKYQCLTLFAGSRDMRNKSVEALAVKEQFMLSLFEIFKR